MATAGLEGKIQIFEILTDNQQKKIAEIVGYKYLTVDMIMQFGPFHGHTLDSVLYLHQEDSTKKLLFGEKWGNHGRNYMNIHTIIQ